MKKLFILLTAITTILTAGYNNIISVSANDYTLQDKPIVYVISNNSKSIKHILNQIRYKPFSSLALNSIYDIFLKAQSNGICVKLPFCTYDTLQNTQPEETTAPVTQAPEVTTQVTTTQTSITTQPTTTTQAPTTTRPITTTHAPTTTKVTTQAPPVVETPTPETPASDYASEVVRLVNIERAKYGLSPLKMTQNLNNAATVRANEIVTSFSHTRPNGTSCFTVLKELGISYNTCGENIAAGQRTPAEVVNAWMNSEGHRANILNSSFNKIGIGVAQKSSSYGIYWAQMFTN